MKNENRTSNLNFRAQLFWKSKNHLVLCFMSQLQYRNENRNFISIFVFQFIKKTKGHFRYTDFCFLTIYKNIYFIKFRLSFFNGKLLFIYEGEQPLIHLMRPTTKEEKITQYDVNTRDTVLV